MFYCNDRDRFMTNSKECWLRTGFFIQINIADYIIDKLE